MKVFRYWASAELSTQDKNGKLMLLKKWAGSNDSASEAKVAAERALRALQDRVRDSSPRTLDEYAYGVRDVPEELIREFGEKSAITRNRMGCLVLNTAELMFADVDIRKPGFFARLGGASLEKNEQAALAQLRQFMDARPSLGVRIYRTKAGFRYLFTHAPMAVNDESLSWLSALNSDKLYTKLCREQECFRARLTPKPYRLGIKLPENRFPRETPESRDRFSGWLANYDQRSGNYAVCKFVETVGKSSIHSALTDLVKEHDRATRSDSALPLA